MKKESLSVVVPTYNSSNLLKLTLSSLTKQTLKSSEFEVIVCDDGSVDDTEDIVSQFGNALNINYCFQKDRGYRVSSARNMGIKNAGTDNILFLDTGMIAHQKLLERHQEIQNSTPCVLIGLSFGLTEFDEVDCGTIERLIDNQDLPDVFNTLIKNPAMYDCRYSHFSEMGFDLTRYSYPWVVFWTGHVSCKKADLTRVGMFDESFNSWGGEDVELAIRLHKLGRKFVLLDEMLTINYPHERDEDSKIQSSKENIKYICRKHFCVDGVQKLLHLGWEDILKSGRRHYIDTHLEEMLLNV